MDMLRDMKNQLVPALPPSITPSPWVSPVSDSACWLKKSTHTRVAPIGTYSFDVENQLVIGSTYDNRIRLRPRRRTSRYRLDADPTFDFDIQLRLRHTTSTHDFDIPPQHLPCIVGKPS
ncbi:hypothetical protein BJY04DRAFT_184147, partial [Aspergillus karnatakaensis]|uniref:uncharacterized protein n=1 Tax=Aspergillus karnatakaensis TaxID=1810916 RepID=UPI003CCD4385